MCGIAGFLGTYPAGTVRRMAALVAHRGPDDEGLFFDSAGGLALAHRRLAIQDPSPAGHQPMTDRSARFTICYNGEVYNAPELRSELQGRGATFRGRSDTEVILELFARFGPESFRRLNGIFALAIWDSADRRLVLARDGMGVKPLYLAETASGLGFASEIKALLALPDLDRTIDLAVVASYITYLWSPGEATMLRGVSKLDPGTWLSVERGGRRASGTFYRLPDPAPARHLSKEELLTGTRDALRTSVERQMLADVEVGAFLSGGLDSSSIVAFAREFAGASRLQCFTIDYHPQRDEEDEMVADLPYARRAAEHLGVDLHEIPVDASMTADFERMVYHLDEPQADPAGLMSLYIAEVARSRGIKVLLSGTGGDDLLTGYRRHHAAMMEPYWAAVPRSLRSGIAAAAAMLPTGSTRLRRIRKLLSPIGGALEDRLVAYYEWFSAEAAAALIVGGPRPAEFRRPLYELLHHSRGWHPVERVLRLDQRFFLTDHNLNYVDKTGMAAGVEIRVPFLDPDFTAWAAALPLSAKMRGGQTKWALRKAMEPLLPHDIIYRPKTGFGVPLRTWLKGKLRPVTEELLSPAVLSSRGLFDLTEVQRLKEATFAGKVDGSYALFALMAIELWARLFVDSAAARSERPLV